MKLKLGCSLILLLITHFLFAQDSSKIIYPFVVGFHSKCCGVPSERPLLEIIQGFKAKNHIEKISVDKIGPIGREGEYNLAFGLSELNPRQVKALLYKVKKLPKQKADRGYITVTEQMEIDSTTLMPRTKISKLEW